MLALVGDQWTRTGRGRRAARPHKEGEEEEEEGEEVEEAEEEREGATVRRQRTFRHRNESNLVEEENRTAN